jgi:hypothetical protein
MPYNLLYSNRRLYINTRRGGVLFEKEPHRRLDPRFGLIPFPLGLIGVFTTVAVFQ